uniref:Uncharacterized protein n=1 Tax=Setaria viridis TaxID=4556 RepID=A0A4V6D727_SETVI|nr:hypothetical protein SEVIR_5G294866v2 [Setaria viridis]
MISSSRNRVDARTETPRNHPNPVEETRVVSSGIHLDPVRRHHHADGGSKQGRNSSPARRPLLRSLTGINRGAPLIPRPSLLCPQSIPNI